MKLRLREQGKLPWPTSVRLSLASQSWKMVMCVFISVRGHVRKSVKEIKVVL